MLKEQFLKIAQEYDGLAVEVEGGHAGTTSRYRSPEDRTILCLSSVKALGAGGRETAALRCHALLPEDLREHARVAR